MFLSGAQSAAARLGVLRQGRSLTLYLQAGRPCTDLRQPCGVRRVGFHAAQNLARLCAPSILNGPTAPTVRRVGSRVTFASGGHRPPAMPDTIRAPAAATQPSTTRRGRRAERTPCARLPCAAPDGCAPWRGVGVNSGRAPGQ
eukprot:scaffold998_cov411-Prasinococcus_capsulatus_cf.AAC.26